MLKNKLIAAVVLSLLSLDCFSAYHHKTAEIDSMRSFRDDVKYDQVFLKGISSLGSCGVNNGLVAFVLTEDMDREYSMLLAAKLAGKKVKIQINDDTKDPGGFCVVRYVELVD